MQHINLNVSSAVSDNNLFTILYTNSKLVVEQFGKPSRQASRGLAVAWHTVHTIGMGGQGAAAAPSIVGVEQVALAPSMAAQAAVACIAVVVCMVAEGEPLADTALD